MPASLKTWQYIIFTLSFVHQPDDMAKLAIRALNIPVTILRLTSIYKCGRHYTWIYLFYCHNSHGKAYSLFVF